MKKLATLSVLSLGLILLAGCDFGSNNQGSSDILAVWEDGHEMTCNLTYESDVEKGTSTLYVKDDMIRQDSTSTIEGEDEPVNIYTLAKDGVMYVWGDIFGENVGLSEEYEIIDMEEELSAFTELDEGSSITCKKGVRSSKVFNLPNDIEFTSMGEFAEDIDLEDLEGYEDMNELSESDEEIGDIAE